MAELSEEYKERIKHHMQRHVFKQVGAVADSIGQECYVVGGYVRDIFLNRHSKDIDFVTVGSGITLAEHVAALWGDGTSLAVYANFGTAQVKNANYELEFVGARKESYSHDSRKPVVENGTLADDQCRRDFTINAMALSLNADCYGSLIDPFDGIGDLERRIIRTPLNPDITFSDDPLRMMRAIRFATQLNFDIYPETFDAIARNRERIHIISRERIADELMKILNSPVPSRGFMLLDKCGLLEYTVPGLAELKGVDSVNNRGHKDNFLHTMQVLDKVAELSDNVWLRCAALFHDIGKPQTKHYDEKLGWTFHNHNFVGEKMIPRIFRKMKFPLNEHMKYVQKMVGLHMRPIALVEDYVTDSAVRRLLFDAGDDIDDLMILCKCDITSKNEAKVRRLLSNFELVRQKMVELEARDKIRNFQPPVSGNDIMEAFNLGQCHEVGEIKKAIKDAILDGIIPNDRDAALDYMRQIASNFLNK
ncbi:MAG: HD domain-containing protein [Muribaculaceae bacterium]|nr:HD domain-containing protein [Muribaculaceae bacterium]